MIRSLALLLAATLTVAAPPVSAATPTSSAVAVCDLPRVVSSIPEGRAVRKQIQSLAAKRVANIKRQKAELVSSMHKVARDKSLSDAERQARLSKLSAQRETLSAQAHDIEKDLRAQQDRLLKPVLDKVRGAVASLAKERGFAVVLGRRATGVLYRATEPVDITDAVIARLRP